jgi:UTP:GlnB (protein PII) uridylyltransferase
VKNLVEFILKKNETRLEFSVNAEVANIFGYKVDGAMNVKNVEVEYHYGVEP